MVNFIKRILKKFYKITKVISNCDVVSKVTVAVVTIIFAFGLRFGSLKPIEGSVILPLT
jgi:hypothetical protein